MPRKSKVNTVAPQPIVEEAKPEDDVPVIAEVVKKTRGRKPKVVPAPVVADEPKTVIVKKERRPNEWILFCKEVQKENPNKSYREILKIAKLSYKKGSTSE